MKCDLTPDRDTFSAFRCAYLLFYGDWVRFLYAAVAGLPGRWELLPEYSLPQVISLRGENHWKTTRVPLQALPYLHIQIPLTGFLGTAQ